MFNNIFSKILDLIFLYSFTDQPQGNSLNNYNLNAQTAEQEQ